MSCSSSPKNTAIENAIEKWLESYVVIDAPSPGFKHKALTRTKAMHSPSPRTFRKRRMRAITCVTESDMHFRGVDLEKLSQRLVADFNSNSWLENPEKKKISKNEADIQSSSSFGSSSQQAAINHRMYGRTRSHTVAGSASPALSTSSKRSKGTVRRNVARRGTQSLTSMAVRKKPILPAKYTPDEATWKLLVSNGRRNSMAALQKKTRRKSEPYLFTSTGKLRKTSLAAPAKQFQGNSHKRRLSSTTSLLPGANKIRLQELANTELLASLNEPFDKNVPEHDGTDDEKDATDYAVAEEQSELQKLTELKRVKVIEEIFETEKKYIACLDTVDKVFKIPMSDGGIAQEKEVSALFPSCLATIKECHSWFMEQLENRMKSEDWSGGIGDILGKMAGPLKENLLHVYTDYVNAFPKSISTFSKCSRTSHKFRKFIEECYAKSDNLDLPSYLITPVQRLPRYVLLLRQLSKYTNEDHADSASIKTALLQMEELIFSLNSSIHSSMQAYTSRESETRKTIRRQLSRRRKKPRPLSLNIKDLKMADEKLSRAPLVSQNGKGLNLNYASEPNRMKTVSELPSPNDEKDSKELHKSRTDSRIDEKSNHLHTNSCQQGSPVVLRKNKSDGRKSFRRSLGAALSSFWSPKDDKDLKDVNEGCQCQGLQTDVDANSNANGLSRRKFGVSYPSSAVVMDGNDANSPQAKNDNEVVKRRRFSGSFREKTRNFRIQMRRRSGTWFSATAEKASDLDLSQYPSSAPSFTISGEYSSNDGSPNTPRRNTKSRSSFMSLFSKRKAKLVAEEDPSQITRRRSDSHKELDPTDTAAHKLLSTSISAPVMIEQRKISVDSRVASSICEETIEDIETSNDCLSGEKEDSLRLSNEFEHANGNVSLTGEKHEPLTEKKRKKGKIMKTLRNIVGKNKS